MIGSFFIENTLLGWVLILHLEVIFFIFFKKIFLITSERKERLVKNKDSIIVNMLPLNIYLSLINFNFICLKVPYSTNLAPFISGSIIFIFILFIFLVLALWYFVQSGYRVNFFLMFTLQNLLLFLILLLFCDSILIFLFILELFSVYYYFFFLNIYTAQTKTTLLQYKNLILFYLWNSFLTTILFGVGIFIITLSTGTLSFFELKLIYLTEANQLTFMQLGFTFIFVSLGWKLGLPGFHFFKIEIYKFLDSHIIFFFSIITISINCILVYFFILQDVVLILINQHYFLMFLPIFMGLCLVFFFTVNHLYNFLAVSSLVTIFTALLGLFI